MPPARDRTPLPMVCRKGALMSSRPLGGTGGGGWVREAARHAAVALGGGHGALHRAGGAGVNEDDVAHDDGLLRQRHRLGRARARALLLVAHVPPWAAS